MDKIETGFLRILADDVLRALDKINDKATPSDRRNALRVMISAAEGMTWWYRSHILAMARDMEVIESLDDMGFAEFTVFVSETDKVSKQVRNLSMTASIRLTTRVAKSIMPDLNVDFGTPEWENLKSAIRVRNRVTHPKTEADLIVSDKDIEMARSGFFWLGYLTVEILEKAVKEYASYVAGAAEVVDNLIKRDPETLALYRRVLNERDN